MFAAASTTAVLHASQSIAKVMYAGNQFWPNVTLPQVFNDDWESESGTSLVEVLPNGNLRITVVQAGGDQLFDSTQKTDGSNSPWTFSVQTVSGGNPDVQLDALEFNESTFLDVYDPLVNGQVSTVQIDAATAEFGAWHPVIYFDAPGVVEIEPIIAVKG